MKSAAKRFKASLLIGVGRERLDIAPRPVFSLSYSERISLILASVHSAARRLWLTVTGRRPIVPVSVTTEVVAVPVKTFNLTLREHNAYYANGILVFNCLTWARRVAPLSMRRNYELKTHPW